MDLRRRGRHSVGVCLLVVMMWKVVEGLEIIGGVGVEGDAVRGRTIYCLFGLQKIIIFLILSVFAQIT